MEIQYIMHKGKEKKQYYCAECKFKSTRISAYKAHVHSNKHIYNLTGDSNYQPPVILRTKNQTIKRITDENEKLKEENEKLKNRVTFFEENVQYFLEHNEKLLKNYEKLTCSYAKQIKLLEEKNK